MAMTINSSPELWGISADLFIKEAEHNGKRPTPTLTEARESEIADFLRKSREYVFPPIKKG